MPNHTELSFRFRFVDGLVYPNWWSVSVFCGLNRYLIILLWLKLISKTVDQPQHLWRCRRPICLSDSQGHGIPGVCKTLVLMRPSNVSLCSDVVSGIGVPFNLYALPEGRGFDFVLGEERCVSILSTASHCLLVMTSQNTPANQMTMQCQLKFWPRYRPKNPQMMPTPGSSRPIHPIFESQHW